MSNDQKSTPLKDSLYEDSRVRFGITPNGGFAQELTELTCSLIAFITEARNVAQF